MTEAGVRCLLRAPRRLNLFSESQRYPAALERLNIDFSAGGFGGRAPGSKSRLKNICCMSEAGVQMGGWTIVTTSPRQSQNLGRILGKLVQGGEIVWPGR